MWNFLRRSHREHCLEKHIVFKDAHDADSEKNVDIFFVQYLFTWWLSSHFSCLISSVSIYKFQKQIPNWEFSWWLNEKMK